MATAKEIQEEVLKVFKTSWKRRDGDNVPEPEDVKLGNDAVLLDGTVLYADLADSTGLVDQYKDFFAAEVYKAYLLAICKIIREGGGELTAFDGDRIMAVYIGKSKNSNAAKSALRINWVVQKIVNPAIKQVYPNTSFQVKQAVGIDTGPLFIARTGIRGSNDLVWVGRAANYAAKLCSLRDGNYSSFITESVYKKLTDKSKYGGDPRRSMWEKTIWDEMGVPIYRSTWRWSIS